LMGRRERNVRKYILAGGVGGGGAAILSGERA
jgi:hypothetical protein